MNQPWTAKHVVATEQARSLIEAQFPELRPARVEPLAVGWDNTAYLVNDEYVFRFPRREIAIGLLESERRLLPAIAARLPLTVPVPEFFGEPDMGYPWAFAGYAFLPGTAADVAQLTDQQRAAAAEPLGEFLAALHAVPIEEAKSLGLAGDEAVPSVVEG